ncbi:sine oculis-binding protein homolog [Artemia franciscana]|uniref:Sine oculis-binding protein n=1 Tax=Artemia franciscana TaxID=6661 RepID=A0AA88HYW3_ARTSF|nr:hypothetical protein QYM36_006979 [Artemia franciscana]
MSTGISRKKMATRLTRSRSRLSLSGRKEFHQSDSDSDNLESEMKALGVRMKEYAERTGCLPRAATPEENMNSLADGEQSGEGTCFWCFKLGPKAYSQKNPSTNDKHTFCCELCFSQWRRATFKKGKICDWCKHVRNTVNYTDQLDGEHALQFCSDKCLNSYKMSVFCKETQAHLQLLQCMNGSESKAKSNHLSAKEVKKLPRADIDLITPELWMRNCKDPSPDTKDDDEGEEENVIIKEEIFESDEEVEETPIPKRVKVQENEPTCKMTKMLLKRAEMPLKLRQDLKKTPGKTSRKHRKETKRLDKSSIPPLYPIVPGFMPNISALMQQSVHNHQLPWATPTYIRPAINPDFDEESANVNHTRQGHSPPVKYDKGLSPVLQESLPLGLTIERVEKPRNPSTPSGSEFSQTSYSHQAVQTVPTESLQDNDFFKALLSFSTVLMPFPVVIPVPVPIPLPIDVFPVPETNSKNDRNKANTETLDLSTKKNM